MPVAFFHSVRVATGSASPAETQRRIGVARNSSPRPAMLRYVVGAVNSTVAPNVRMPSTRSLGDAFSSSTVDAPTLIGNSSRPPSPNVNAIGGLPMKMSSARGLSTCGGQHVQMARMSR
ncbi:hypothetical protein DL770_011481 [Monosporascus sp. CRB-9-2]|nr:hypothetical protein DL770_011481 [Monosporascus sp. CRB-9-2]